MLAGDPKAAIPIFDQAIALDPELVEARFNRGIALLKMNQLARASAEFAAIGADEKSRLRAPAAYHNALALDRMGRRADAERWLEKALVADPDLDAALLYLGTLRERRGDLEGAARAYLDYLKKHPDSTLAMLRIGVAAQLSGRNDVARAYLQRVIDEAPESIEATEARKFLVMWE